MLAARDHRSVAEGALIFENGTPWLRSHMAVLAGDPLFRSWTVIPLAERLLEPDANRIGNVVALAAELRRPEVGELLRLVASTWIVQTRIERAKDTYFVVLPRLQVNPSTGFIATFDLAVANNAGHSFAGNARSARVS